MISKELLSEVLGEDRATSCNKLEMEIGNNFLIVDDWIKINIYELAHKCKEYALSKGYYLRAEQGVNYKDNLQWTAFLNTSMDDGADYVDYWNNTEPEAIFKAAQWVLDNTSTNKLKGH